jgi:hypothetical protein
MLWFEPDGGIVVDVNRFESTSIQNNVVGGKETGSRTMLDREWANGLWAKTTMDSLVEFE